MNATDSTAGRGQEEELKEFAELSPTERCIVLLNFTALCAGVLNFVVRLTGAVLGQDEKLDAFKSNKRSVDDKAGRPSSSVTGDDLFELVVINAISVAGVISVLSGSLIWLSVHLLLLFAYSLALSGTLLFFEWTAKAAVLLLLATIYLAVFVRHFRAMLQQRLRLSQSLV